ncbi:ABC-three component system protein [Vibrio furnissii]|uniref:ABC-three component system protein n=1 Tax=Vibrio furnissii TaxID=29494 RepID=UPI0012AE087D|nr:ABC-three component system protein [Vibrio furnissii]
MKNNSTSAVSSWLGYKIQEYRLTQRLLEANNSSCIGFEILDDLEEHTGSTSTFEQDKISTTGRNIVSNHSKDLWKTLSNWMDIIDSGEIDVDNTIFLLFTNKRCHSEVLQLLSTSQTTEEASKAFDEILKIVSHPSPSIANYINKFSKSKTDACRLISKFTYIYGSGSAPHDLRESYKLHRLGALEEHLDEIMYEILGWVSDVLTLAAEKRQPTIVRAKDFGARLGEIESKYRQKTILNYFCNRSSESEDVQNAIKDAPNYIKQLNLINVDDSELEEAAIANLETKDAVVEWTLNGDVQDYSYRYYQRELRRCWGIQKQKIHLDFDGRPETEVGQRLYIECLNNVTRYYLENKKVGDFFAHGTLHSMADKLTIGWHPEFDKKLGDPDA